MFLKDWGVGRCCFEKNGLEGVESQEATTSWHEYVVRPDTKNPHFWSWKVLFQNHWKPQKTNMTMDDLPFEDVFPIENGDVPMSC